MTDGRDTGELKDALRAVLESKRQEAVDDRAARELNARRARRQTPLLLTMLVLWGALAYLWIARPAAIFGESGVRAMTEAQREAHMRFALYLERSRVDGFRRTHGRLPAVLEDAGPVEDGVSYSTTGTGYLLEGTANGASLRLTDRMAADSFLGRSLVVLRGRR